MGPDHLVGKPIHTFLPAEVAALLNKALQSSSESGDIQTLEYEQNVRTGHRYFEGRMAPLRYAIDGHRAVLLIARDITDLKQAEAERRQVEEKLRQTQRLESIGVLAGGIAHDFNNLLMGVLGNADLALLVLPAESPTRQRVQNIKAAALRLADLTRQLLAYSGKGKFLTERLSLSRVVEEMAHMLEISIPKNVVLKYDLAPKLPTIEVDATQLRQVIMNLITNAAEAIDNNKSGIVSLRTGVLEADRKYIQEMLKTDLAEGCYAFIEVSDTGCGMDRETLARIFDPFFTTKFTGRGLGLAAVYGIVRGHKGAIKIISEPGQGTTFKVLFPCVMQDEAGQDEAGMTAAEAIPRQGVARLCGTILVVDDDQTVRAVTRMILEKLGFTALCAADGREAVALFRERACEIDAVLLDLTMPHMDGVETFTELRRIQPDVLVILSSGYSEQDSIARFTGKGLAGFIQKPYDTKELMEKIQTVLGQGV